MKKWATALGIFIAANLSANYFDVDFDLGAGYRQDSLKWSIAGPNNTPNVLSELSWNKLRILQFYSAAKMVTPNSFVAKGYADYGKIHQGRNRDSDYAGNDKTLEFSRSDNNAGRGEVFDLSAAIGYQWDFCEERFSLSPFVGVSHHEQHLQMYNGNQVVNTVFPQDVGPFPNLHSAYKARWSGPWAGFDLFYRPSCDLDFFGGFEYHWATFHGKGHWNLRTDFFGDFKQHAHGYGLLGTLGMKWRIFGCWKIGILGEAQIWKTRHGKDHTVVLEDIRDPEGNILEVLPATVEQRLNKVQWCSFSVSATLVYAF